MGFIDKDVIKRIRHNDQHIDEIGILWEYANREVSTLLDQAILEKLKVEGQKAMNKYKKKWHL